MEWYLMQGKYYYVLVHIDIATGWWSHGVLAHIYDE